MFESYCMDLSVLQESPLVWILHILERVCFQEYLKDTREQRWLDLSSGPHFLSTKVVLKSERQLIGLLAYHNSQYGEAKYSTNLGWRSDKI